MLSSFTNDEKKVLVFLVALLSGGMIAVSVKHGRPEPLFLDSYKPSKESVVVSSAIATTTTSLAASMSAAGGIDINSANAEVLASVPGIGPSLAQEIIAHRTAQGPFHNVDELDNVKGIGAAKLAKMRQFVCIGASVGSGTAGGASAPAANPTVSAPQAATAATTVQASPAAGVMPGAAALAPAAMRSNAAATAAPATQGQVPVNALAPATPAATPITYSAPAVRPASASEGAVVNINTAQEAELATLKGVGPVLAKRIIEYRVQHGGFPNVNALEDVKGIGPKILENNRTRLSVR